MIEIDDDTYILGFWFVPLEKPLHGDWMACISKKRGEQFTLKCRFRYYVTSDPWDGKDQKNWYSGGLKDESLSEEALIAQTNMLVDVMAASLGVKASKIVSRKWGFAALDDLKGQEWFNMKTMKEDPEAAHD